MNHQQTDQKIARQSALIYLPISLGSALLFYLVSTFTGEYPNVARLGGTIWVGLLSLIVSMPLVIDRLKKNFRR